MVSDESHVQTQPLRVHRIPGHPHDRVIVESLLQKPALTKVAPAERLIARRYRLKERLRRRRLGVVFATVDELGWIEGQDHQRRVAVQFLDAKLIVGTDFDDRFERGVSTLQSLEHPGIVSLLDAGRDGGRYFLVLEMPDSGTLRYVLDDVRELPATETGAVVRAIGDALEYLHARSIVHGNLKPENVVVTFDFEVKLLDVVPPEWPPMPPVTPDVREDVFGLGCLAYEMLTGRHPFDGNTPREALRAGLRPEPVARLPAMQWRALAGALELDAAQRTPTVRRFLEEFGVLATAGLRAIVAGDMATIAPPIEKPAPSIGGGDVLLIPERARYEPKRRGIGGKLFLLMLVALVALAWKYQDVLREKATALVATVNSWVPATPEEGSPAAESTTPAAPVEEVPLARATATPDGSVTISAAPAEAPPLPSNAAATPPARRMAAPRPAALAPAVAAPEEAPPVAAGPTRFSFVQPAVQVAESEVAARVMIRRSGNLSGHASIAWWTAPGSADAERDFADLGRRVEQFQPGERQRTIFVPLSNDTEVEPTEYFNVFIGDVQGGVSPQAGLQVEITDDD